MCPPVREVGSSGEGLAVDLVGEDSQGKRFVDGLVEADEQLEKALTTVADQHSVGAVFIGGCSVSVKQGAWRPSF